jgi:hypothetical protein
MIREEFIEQYILSRTSHKLSIDELLRDAIKAWKVINQK